MSSAIQVEINFVQESERVKSVDVHPTKPWILGALHSGSVSIWNYQSKTMEKTIKIIESPIRAAKFIERKKWIVVGADDTFIRVYNYETMEKIKEFKAHEDFIRYLDVHPTLPLVLSASDDKFVKLWNWEEDWICNREFAGHSHYVMQTTFDPNNINSFASVSLDGTIKVWNIEATTPTFTLDTRTKGLNCVTYSTHGDKILLIVGSDDFTTQVWDYESKSCITTLEVHTNNITDVYMHPYLSIILTSAEDNSVSIWNAKDFSFLKTLSFDLGRVWTIGCIQNSNQIVFGCDKGIIIINVVGVNVSNNA